MSRPGGNFTQAEHDYNTGRTWFVVYVRWQRQPFQYATAIEAEQGLRDAVNPSPLPFRPRRQETA